MTIQDEVERAKSFNRIHNMIFPHKRTKWTVFFVGFLFAIVPAIIIIVVLYLLYS